MEFMGEDHSGPGPMLPVPVTLPNNVHLPGDEVPVKVGFALVRRRADQATKDCS